jgi:large subunit ribosomal protein L3
MKFIIGKKLEMTQLWQGEEVIAVTKIQAGPCVVTQTKDKEKDGYIAAQLGFGQKKDKNIKKPQKGHLNKLKKADSSFKTDFRYLKEFRFDKSKEEKPELSVGDVITVDTFESGDKVNISGSGKGKGFQGVVKRHGFAGAIKTHGTKDQERMPGSAGAMGAGKVFKGKKMPGRMGGKTITTTNLEVIDIDTENNIIYIKGAVTGSRDGLVLLEGKGELKKKAPKDIPSVLGEKEEAKESEKPKSETEEGKKDEENKKTEEEFKEEKQEDADTQKENNNS